MVLLLIMVPPGANDLSFTYFHLHFPSNASRNMCLTYCNIADLSTQTARLVQHFYRSAMLLSKLGQRSLGRSTRMCKQQGHFVIGVLHFSTRLMYTLQREKNAKRQLI